MNKNSIFITGAAHGIGKATAKLFAQKGWFVGLADINESGLQAVQQEIGDANCSVHLANVTNVEQLEKAISEFGQQTGGKMHVLFNNAGILIPGGFEKVSLQQHKAVVDVNFIGVMNTTHLALPLLKQTPNSCVVTMCSASSMYGNPEILAYAATKSAVKSLTEGWNMLFRKHDIRVCDILPAYVNTNMVTDNADEMKLDQKDIKLSPEAIAQAVWEASHSNKMHHYTGTDAKTSAVLKRILPSSVFQWVLEKTIYKEAIKKN